VLPIDQKAWGRVVVPADEMWSVVRIPTETEGKREGSKVGESPVLPMVM